MRTDEQPEVVRRLVRAWISIGVGGLIMLMSSAFVASSLGHPSRAALVFATLGALLALRGSASAKQIRYELTPIGALQRHPLPIARLR